MQIVEKENYETMKQLATELGLRKQTLSLYTSNYMLNKYVKYMQSINPITLRKKNSISFFNFNSIIISVKRVFKLKTLF